MSNAGDRPPSNFASEPSPNDLNQSDVSLSNYMNQTNEIDPNANSSNEALPLLTKPDDQKRCRLSGDLQQNLNSDSSISSNNNNSSISNTLPTSSSINWTSSSLITPVVGAPFVNTDNLNLDTESIAKEIRTVLRQKAMRQTDLAPFIGCRPGSVAGVIAKAKVPWAQLNEFNRSVFIAMAKWLDGVRSEPLLRISPGVPIPSSSTVSPAPSSSTLPTVFNRQTISPDVLNNNTVHSSSSSPPDVKPPVSFSQPWATAKCTVNSSYLLFLENVYMALPGRGTLLSGANLSIAFAKRYGLIGPSECGTSAFLRFLATKEDLNIPPDMEILACDLSNLDSANEFVNVPETERTVDYVIDLERRWRKLKAEETVLEPLVKTGGNQEAFSRLRQIYEQLCFFGSGAAEAKVRHMLSGLGFSTESQNSPIKDLSLRARKVVAMARALIAEPALLLLDRPTNLLDVDAIIWLESFLKNWPTSLLIVSQDRSFLDEVCSAIIYLHNQKLFYYQGNYTRFKQVNADQQLLQK